MQSDPPARQPEEELNEEDLEFKPIVKYTAVGLALVALLGIEYATYALGRSHGFNEGVTSGVVSKAVNDAAVENLTHFMRVATADEATLLAAVSRRDEELAWIKDPAVRREAEWVLAFALLNRRKASAAEDTLEGLFASAEADELWAHRALIVARAMAEAGNQPLALHYYRFASRAYAALQQVREQAAVLSEMVGLIAAPTDNPTEQLKALGELEADITALGDTGKPLLAGLLAHMGRIHRAHGNREEAISCFGRALEGADLSHSPALAGAAVSMGSALLEQGDTERAAILLRDGISRLGEHPGDAAYLPAALRDLARIELESGNPDNALALLYRAEGAAMGRVPENSPYWLFLYDQRGWISFTKESYEVALADFNKALMQEGVPAEHRALPLEGAGRCCLTLGRAEDALKFLNEAAALRAEHFAGDRPAQGRVYVLLAQAHDLAGNIREAADNYAKAIDFLPDAPGENSDRFNAMMARAYALSQMKDWNAAIQAWNALRPLVERGSARAAEVEEQVSHCLRYGATLSEEVDADDDAEAESGQ